MDKHTRHILIFHITLLVASLAAFCVMFLLPLIGNGRSPPNAAQRTKRRGVFCAFRRTFPNFKFQDFPQKVLTYTH